MGGEIPGGNSRSLGSRPLVAVQAGDEHRVPEGADPGAAAVQEPRQPRVQRPRAVAVPVPQQLLVDPESPGNSGSGAGQKSPRNSGICGQKCHRIRGWSARKFGDLCSENTKEFQDSCSRNSKEFWDCRLGFWDGESLGITPEFEVGIPEFPGDFGIAKF